MDVGVDIGGTFTDLVLSQNGQLTIHKLPSSPQDPSQALLQGLSHFHTKGFPSPKRVIHGSTVATNAILERKGGRTALITTQGFKDILSIGRQDRPDLYALHPHLPPPLIPEQLCFEVPERLNHRGDILTPLDEDAVGGVLDQLEKADIESAAVCFLYSYIHPEHERRLKARILERGFLKEWQISLSSDVLPEFREYERASTVSLEAYVRPVVSAYLENIQAGLPEASSLQIMNSDGGVMSAERARKQSIHTALSGPAAGVIGGFHIAQQAGFDRVITLDMGGTSTDVSLCPGERVHRTESEIDGLPLRIRMIDIETIGAGGGSIVRLDPAGGLHVGPQSAGADPGPIVYGGGGENITVTDANALLGRIDPAFFLGGDMPLHLDKAQKAFTSLGERMDLTPQQASLGVIRITNANIERALRRVSIGRGYDPRHFTLTAFGGAGPLHACEVAQRLEIPRVLIPLHPGVLCAYGLLMSDVIMETSHAVMSILTGQTLAQVKRQIEERKQSAFEQLRREGLAKEAIQITPLVDARYQGQSFELTIPFTDDLESTFHKAHKAQYGHCFPDREVEIVNLRLQAVGMISKPIIDPEPVQQNDASTALIGKKKGLVGGGSPATFSLYKRELIQPGAHFSGPALVFQMDSTTYLPPHWKAQVDGYHNLILEHKP
ncbi:MAG: hydantoinase/oxoprolinase family protein [Chloroflexota bacterium]